ncbi:MAG: hypothetical protein QM802_03245 [Agriterribacter sp.]
MKLKCIVLVMTILPLLTMGQNNQIKLYIQQIAANKVYLEYLQKGYALVRSGLTTIGRIKDNHFKLDKAFFDHLDNINPFIELYVTQFNVSAAEEEMEKRITQTLKTVKKEYAFTGAEVNYFRRVFESVQTDRHQLLDEYALLLTSGSYTMGDDERLTRLQAVLKELSNSYVFFESFSREIMKTILQRRKEKNDAHILNQIQE